MRNNPPTDLAQLLLEYTRPKNLRLIETVLPPIEQGKGVRFAGAVLGLAVGDILGCPVEGMSYQDIQSTFRGGVQGLAVAPRGRHWRQPGLHSDDTQQALAILEAMVKARNRFASEKNISFNHLTALELADIYLRGIQSRSLNNFGCWRGTGQGFRNSIQRIAQSLNSKDFPYGQAEASSGLGAIMRIPPVGLLHTNLEELAQRCAYLTVLTHSVTTATTSAFAAAYACHLLGSVHPAAFKADEFIRRLAEETRKVEEKLPEIPEAGHPFTPAGQNEARVTSSLILAAGDLAQERPDVAMRQLASITAEHTGKRFHPTSGYAPSGLAACLYFFLHDAQDAPRALLTCINAGGDTDTTGAIVGAFGGALHGPRAFAQYLPDVLALDLIFDKIQAILSPTGDSKIDLVEEETILTHAEETLLQSI